MPVKKTSNNAQSLQPVQSTIQLNNQPVSIKVDSVSNNETVTSVQKQSITNENPSTNNHQLTVNTQSEIQNPELETESQKQTNNKQEQLTQNQADSLDFIDYQLRMNKMVSLSDKLFKVDDEINYEHRLEFVPNYSIFKNPEIVEQEISELVKFLEKFPNKKVLVYGNGGLEVDKSYTYKDIHYQINPRTNETVKVYYGSNHLVYEQILYNLGNVSDVQKRRTKEEGLREVTSAQVGLLLYERARAVKKLLVQHGIDKKRIKALRGEYTPYPNHTIRIKIK